MSDNQNNSSSGDLADKNQQPIEINQDDSQQKPVDENIQQAEKGVLQPQTSNLKPQSENMEVHKHPHHVTHKKKWIEYLLEFFMIFLAVFLGFVAENIREHIVENNRAKQFARLLVDDLAADTIELNKAQKVWRNIVTASDSLAWLLKENNKIPGGKLYYYEYWSGWKWSVISRDATLQQLKNSGALRYIGDASLIRKILDYEEAIKVIYLLQNKYEPEKIENWNLVQKVFDQSFFDTLETIKGAARDSTNILITNNPSLDVFLKRDYPLNTYDKTVLFELRNWAYNTSRNYSILARDISYSKQKAVEAIEALKKEYDLK